MVDSTLMSANNTVNPFYTDTWYKEKIWAQNHYSRGDIKLEIMQEYCI